MQENIPFSGNTVTESEKGGCISLSVKDSSLNPNGVYESTLYNHNKDIILLLRNLVLSALNSALKPVYNMNFRNRIRPVCLLIIGLIIFSYCSSYRVMMTEEEIRQDPGVQIYEKMVWFRTFSFIFIENDSYYTQSYYISTNKKTGIVRVRKDTTICPASSEGINNFCYSAKELKKYSEKDIHLQNSMAQIDSNFFDLTNFEKMKALDRWIIEHSEITE